MFKESITLVLFIIFLFTFHPSLFTYSSLLPYHLKAENLGDGKTIILSWEVSEYEKENIKEFIIKVKEKETTKNLITQSLNYLITNLTVGTTYTFSAQSKSKDGSLSEESEEIKRTCLYFIPFKIKKQNNYLYLYWHLASYIKDKIKKFIIKVDSSQLIVHSQKREIKIPLTSTYPPQTAIIKATDKNEIIIATSPFVPIDERKEEVIAHQIESISSPPADIPHQLILPETQPPKEEHLSLYQYLL